MTSFNIGDRVVLNADRAVWGNGQLSTANVKRGDTGTVLHEYGGEAFIAWGQGPRDESSQSGYVDTKLLVLESEYKGEFKVGDRVRITNICGGKNSHVGKVGVLEKTNVYGYDFRVFSKEINYPVEVYIKEIEHVKEENIVVNEEENKRELIVSLNSVGIERFPGDHTFDVDNIHDLYIYDAIGDTVGVFGSGTWQSAVYQDAE